MQSGRTLSLEEATRDYPLFELKKLLSLRLSANGAGDHVPSKEDGQPLHFTAVAFGGYEGHSVMAMACSNDFLLFRHLGETGVPMVRHLAWFREPNKKIVAMDFNPSAQWLLCVTGDSTIILIPLYFLMHRKVDPPSVSETNIIPPTPKKSSGKGAFSSLPTMKKRTSQEPPVPGAPGWIGPNFPSLMSYAHGTAEPNKLKTGDTFGSLNDITVIKALSRPKAVKVTQCLWWRPIEGGDYGIISTKRGKISIVDFYQQKEVYVIRIRHRIKKIEKVDSESYTYLLVRTRRAYYKLLLEHRVSDNPPTYESIVSRAKTSNETKHSPFNMTVIPNFSNQDGLKLSVQRTKRRGCLLGAYHVNTHTFEIYGPELGKFALFVYQLPAPATHLHLTDHLIFSVTKGEEGSIVSVVSNWNAATSAEPHWYYKHHKDSVLQEFLLPEGQYVKGVFRALSPPVSNKRNRSISISSGAEITASYLPGFFLWTSDTIYECRQNASPEEVFFQLIGQGLEKSAEAESLGKTMGLDVLGLYEAAADRFFDDGHYDRALSLYHLSNVDSSKLISKFAGKGRMEDVIAHLVMKLHMRDTLSVSDRRLFSDLLFRCYLYCCLNPTHRGSALAVQKEFRSFLKENSDYDAGAALLALLDQGCTVDFLQVAQSRDLVDRAVDMMVHHGSFYINQKSVLLLKESGHSEELKRCEGGALLRCQPPRLQVKLLVEEISQLPYYIRSISALLPYLEAETLMEIASLLDPTGPTAAKIYAEAALLTQHSHLHGGGSSSTSEINRPECASPEEVLELWIAAVLYIIRSRTASDSDKSVETNNATFPPQIPHKAPPALSAKPEPPSNHTPLSPAQTAIPTAIPPLITTSVRIVSLSAGWHHSCAISDEGTLYTWGKNSSGELGHGEKGDVGVTKPREVTFFKGHFVSYVAAGGQHTVAIATILGRGKQTGVYSWGAGGMGQLGHGDKGDRALPHLIQALCTHTIIQVAAGWAHTLFLSDVGLAFSCGHGEQGQLGTGQTVDRSLPTPIDALSNAVQVACGYCHTVLLTELGDVYTCGTNLWGQLGQIPNEGGGAGSEGVCVSTPSPVSALHGKTLRFIAAGSFHSVALTDLENVYTWGGASGSGGSFGRRDRRQPRVQPRQAMVQRDAFKAACTPHILPMLQGERVVNVSCGHHHTAAVTADGEVYVWGDQSLSEGDHSALTTAGSRRPTAAAWGDAWNQESDDSNTKPRLVSKLGANKIVEVACGEDYTLARSEDGKMYSWGCGTYGQLGQGDTTDASQPEEVDFTSAAPTAVAIIPPQSSTPVAVIPLSLEDWGGYGQEALERVLREKYGKYRPSIVLAVCCQHINWSAAAVILDMLGDWVQALLCRLRSIECHSTTQKGHSDDHTSVEQQNHNAEMNAVFLLMLNLMQLKNNEKKAILVLQVLRYWRRRALPVPALETFLLEHIEEIGYNLALILHNRSGHRNPFAGLPFSGHLYESIAMLCMRKLNLTSEDDAKGQQQDTAYEKAKPGVAAQAENAQLTEEELWGEITATLPSNWDKRARITLPLPSVLSLSATTEEQDVIAFSCDEGHHWGRRAFYEGIMSKFKALLSAFPKDLQMTTSLLLAEYQQPRIALACPVCVYNTLRLELLAECPTLKPWDL